MGLEAQCARLVASCGRKTDRTVTGFNIHIYCHLNPILFWWFYPEKLYFFNCWGMVKLFFVLFCSVMWHSRKGSWLFGKLDVTPTHWLPPPAEEEVILHCGELLDSDSPSDHLIRSLSVNYLFCFVVENVWLKSSSSLKRGVLKATVTLSYLTGSSEHLLKVLITVASQKLRIELWIVLASALVWLRLEEEEED